ncbi:MAG: hypothetical protein IH624_03965 [Phycisphaerae bacterium]|nr:hypothetical protein [Phycisphaerae bacterium]
MVTEGAATSKNGINKGRQDISRLICGARVQIWIKVGEYRISLKGRTMRKKSILFMAAVLLTAGVAGANTVWNPAANPDPNTIVNGAANWNDAANWSNAIPGLDPLDPKAVFNVKDAPECQVTDAQIFGTLVMGDGGSADPHNNVLRIMDGGSLTMGSTSSWTGLGYNRDGGVLIVEEGGLFDTKSHLWFGVQAGGVGRLVINGGTVLVADAIDLGRNADARGFVTINSGILQARYLPDATDSVGSLWNIKFGTLAFTNNYLARPSNLWSRIDAGTIVAFGGKGTLNVERTGGLTLVTAISPMNPSPAYEATIPDGNVELSWTNMAPATEGDPVFVDVWFGTDPESLTLVPGLDGVPNATSVVVDAPVIGSPPTTYYWKVNSYIYGEGMIGDANMVGGDLFKFEVTNDLAPTVQIDTPDTVTWAHEPVQLNATIFDSGDSPVHIEWTSNDASTVFMDPATGLEDATVENPIVVVGNAAGNVTLTATVWDEFNPEKNSAIMLLGVYANACQATRVGAGMAAQYPMDINGDCTVGIEDLAAIVNNWMTNYALEEAIVIP